MPQVRSTLRKVLCVITAWSLPFIDSVSTKSFTTHSLNGKGAFGTIIIFHLNTKSSNHEFILWDTVVQLSMSIKSWIYYEELSWILFLLSLSGWEQNGFVFSKLQLFFFSPRKMRIIMLPTSERVWALMRRCMYNATSNL